MTDSFFLGGTTPNGFSTYLTELVNGDEYYTYILKGGPGTGKSSIMKKIADSFETTEHVIRYYCSSDPESLDAVMLASSKIIIVDGTAPHVFDPLFPGICQRIINLGDCWNVAALRENKESVVRAIRENKRLMRMAADRIKALGAICRDTYDQTKDMINKEMIENSALDFCNKLFDQKSERRGTKTIRQLSAMTRYGYMTRTETINDRAEVFMLSDDMFAASDIFMSSVVNRALECGYDIRLSPCLLFDGTVKEHLLIDDINTAMITSGPLARFSDPNYKHIDCTAFYNTKQLGKIEEQLMNNRLLIDELTSVTGKILDDAKIVHDEIEQYYINAMDFEKLDRVCENLYAELRSDFSKHN